MLRLGAAQRYDARYDWWKVCFESPKNNFTVHIHSEVRISGNSWWIELLKAYTFHYKLIIRELRHYVSNKGYKTCWIDGNPGPHVHTVEGWASQKVPTDIWWDQQMNRRKADQRFSKVRSSRDVDKRKLKVLHFNFVFEPGNETRQRVTLKLKKSIIVLLPNFDLTPRRLTERQNVDQTPLIANGGPV